MKKYHLDLKQFNLYPKGESLLGKYAAGLSGGYYDRDLRRVFHNRRIGLLNRSKIRAYAAAMSDADVGHP